MNVEAKNQIFASDDKKSKLKITGKIKTVNFDLAKIEGDVVSITFLENGDTVIKSTKSERVFEDHIGNFFALNLLSSYKDFDVGYHTIEKNNNGKARTELVKDLKILIKFCLNSLKGFSTETLSKDITLFKVSFVSIQKLTIIKFFLAFS